MTEIAFKTKLGLPVRIRPICMTDAPLLVDLFEHLGPRSRFLRFQRELEGLAPEEVWQGASAIVHLSASEGAAWLALADLPKQPDTLVGIAWYRHIPPDAEVAISVRDDMQGQGIGTTLLLHLAQQAQAAGIHTLRALVRTDNARALALLPHSPFTITQIPQGAYTYIEASLTPTSAEL